MMQVDRQPKQRRKTGTLAVQSGMVYSVVANRNQPNLYVYGGGRGGLGEGVGVKGGWVLIGHSAIAV